MNSVTKWTNDLRIKMEEGSQLHLWQLQAQERKFLAKESDDVETRLRAWQERMQQEQAATIAQMQAKMQQEQAMTLAHGQSVADKNSQLESMTRTLQKQLEVSQKEQNAEASVSALQATAHRSESIAASAEVTEMKQRLLNSEVELSKTPSAQRTFEAQASRALQLSEEREHRRSISLSEIKETCAEEMIRNRTIIQQETAQSVAAAESRGFQRGEMTAMSSASGAGGRPPPNTNWTQTAHASSQPSASQIGRGGQQSSLSTGVDPFVANDPWRTYDPARIPRGGPGGGGSPGGHGGGGGGGGSSGGPGGGPQGPPPDPDPGRGRPHGGPPGPPPGDPGGGGGGPPGDPNSQPNPPAAPRPMDPKRKEADKIEIKTMPKVADFRAWKLLLRDEIAGASGDPQRGFAWIMEVEEAGVSLRTLEDSGLFPTLDAKLAAALSKAIHGEFARRVNVMKE